MNNWLAIPDETKRRAYVQIAEKTGMAPFAVEKDWWVVQTLGCISQLEVGPALIFKGGTSLSKAWKLIHRFSEDIDLAIDREFLGFKGELSKNQRTKMRKASGKFVEESFFPKLRAMFLMKELEGVKMELEPIEESDRDRKINIYYPNVINTPGYLQARVQVEMGCRSLREPFVVQEISSLIDEHYPETDFAQASIRFNTAIPERTFLEKIFLLHEEFQRPKEKMRVERLSRHLYDVVKLAATPFADRAINDKELWEAIVYHRHKFTRVGGVNYNLHSPQTINPLPVPEIMDAWRKDYNSMIEQMIYEESPPSFEEVIEEITRLKEKMNSLPWRLEQEFPLPGKLL
jgi:predicted nucleotidyltransferase component of viral defense system